MDLLWVICGCRLSLLLCFLYFPSPGYVDLINVYVENITIMVINLSMPTLLDESLSWPATGTLRTTYLHVRTMYVRESARSFQKSHRTMTVSKGKGSTAAAPPSVGPIPPSILSINLDAMPSQLLRGPAVLFVATSYLLFTLLLQTSKETQLCLLAIGLGTLLTVCDWAAHIQQSVLALQQRLRKELHSRANAVVLDDVLRSIFAPDTGWIATICGTWIGTAGMYALPLDAEQRVRLFGSGLAEVDGTLDAREVLLRPGGLLRLLPDGWSGGNSVGDSDDSVGERGESKSDRVPIAVASVGQNVRWEDEPQPVGTMDDSMEGEDDSDTADATDEGSDSSSASSAHPPLHHHDADITRRSAPPTRIPRPTTTTQQQQQQQDPATVAASVLSELLGKMLDRSLASVDQTTVQTVGVASALTLALQLRRSPRARSALWTMAQGAAALGLAGTAVGALAISEAKRRRVRGASTAGRTNSGGPSFSTPGATNIPLPTIPFTLIYDSIPPLNEVINDGQRWFRQFMEVAKSPKVIRQLLENPTFRRRLKGFAAVLVMMYFRRRRNQRLAQQKPLGGAGLYA